MDCSSLFLIIKIVELHPLKTTTVLEVADKIRYILYLSPYSALQCNNGREIKKNVAKVHGNWHSHSQGSVERANHEV